MPKLKKHDPPFAHVRRLLLGYEFTGQTVADAIGTSRKTGKDRLDHPEKLTLGELRSICLSGGIPADELREAIRF